MISRCFSWCGVAVASLIAPIVLVAQDPSNPETTEPETTKPETTEPSQPESEPPARSTK